MDDDVKFLITELKTELGQLETKMESGIHALSSSVSGLTTQIKILAENLGKFIPIKLVYLIFLLVFGLVFGIEAIKALLKYIIGGHL